MAAGAERGPGVPLPGHRVSAPPARPPPVPRQPVHLQVRGRRPHRRQQPGHIPHHLQVLHGQGPGRMVIVTSLPPNAGCPLSRWGW